MEVLHIIRGGFLLVSLTAKMEVNVLGVGCKLTIGKFIFVHLVLIVLLSSFAQCEKEPVEAGSAKSDSPSSEVFYQAALKYFFWVAAFS